MSRPGPGRATLPTSVFHETCGAVEPNPRRPTLPMEPAARCYLCACCRTPVLICSDCDRGQRYCARGCAARVRKQCVQAAGKRFQASRRGRHAHAERQRRYRARQAKVTHQGSPPAPPAALLLPETTAPGIHPPSQPLQPCGQCHFCLRNCGVFVRIGFLRCRLRRAAVLPDPKEPHHVRDP